MSDITTQSFSLHDADRSDRDFATAHPIWSRIGDWFERVAALCGTHSAGYMTPLPTKQR